MPDCIAISLTPPFLAFGSPRFFGIAVVAWGRLEGHFTHLIILILNIGRHKRIGKKLPMKWERLMEVWRLAFENVPELTTWKAQADVFISDMDKLAEDRNRIVHGMWELFRPGPSLAMDVTKIRAQSGTEDGLLHGRAFFTPEWLHDFSRRANRLNRDLLTIGEPIVALRGAPPKPIRRL